MKADVDPFFSPNDARHAAPLSVDHEVARALAEEAGANGLGVYHLDGTRMSRQQGLFLEFARALRFPDDFGRTWNALDESLADLDWLDDSAYLVVIDHADAVLREEPADVRNMLTDLLTDVSKEWAENGVTFRCILIEQPPRSCSEAPGNS